MSTKGEALSQLGSASKISGASAFQHLASWKSASWKWVLRNSLTDLWRHEKREEQTVLLFPKDDISFPRVKTREQTAI